MVTGNRFDLCQRVHSVCALALLSFGPTGWSAAEPVPGRFVSGETPAEIYRADWIDLNKNGAKDPYEDPALDTEARITDLLGRMTSDEKTAQMTTLYGYPRVLKDELPTAA